MTETLSSEKHHKSNIMLRKIFFFAIALLSLVSANAAAVGDWNIFTRIAGDIDQIIETPEKVYYTSGNRLFSYDKESDETYAYTTQNKLTDTEVAFIRYNPDNKYLFVAYTNSNIDFLYDNGKVINMSDIKDATLMYEKDINTVNFHGDRVYIGTNFGIVILDDNKHQVVESGIYGIPIQSVVPVGDFLFMNRLYGGTSLYYAPLNGHHNTFDKFTFYTGFATSWIFPLSDNSILYQDRNTENRLSRYTFDFSSGKPSYKALDRFDIVPLSDVYMTQNGNFINTASQIIKIDENGEGVEFIDIPESLRSQILTTNTGASSVWGADADGIANYDIAGGSVTVLADKFKPEGIVTDHVYIAKFDNFGNLWTGNLGASGYRAGVLGDIFQNPQATTRIRDGKPEDMNLQVASAHTNEAAKQQQNNKTTRMYGGCTDFAIDPQNPERYYQGNNLEGLYVIENGEELHKFNWENSPFAENWGSRVQEVTFDHEGNLWVGILSPSADVSPVWILPGSVLQSKEPQQIQASDWLATKHKGIDQGGKDFRILVCKQSPVALSFHMVFRNPLFVLKTNGTLTNPTDDEAFELLQPVDQDGKIWEPDRITCAVEDQKGRVWIGCSAGVIEITDPGSLTPSSSISRIKVPRNDGTNYADYLCEADMIYDIAVDNSNRKWIATESSGVYLVSENGDKIIEHFTKDNSPLPSNQVFSVACDPNSNTVYFGVMAGLISYNSTSSPAADDYSEVYAYPNPVRPEYTGYITITGLMDNSLVKIADAAGNIVYQTRSEGGMAIWDGYDSNNRRAKTGVYYVFASQNENGSSSGAVTKIMIIN